jgi:hypothetical protein
LRETAASFGEQRIYASHNSIMFSRKSCYFFVRPKKSFLEVCVFLRRTVKAPQVRRVLAASKTKVTHIIQIKHRDEVESPITDWLREAYDRFDAPAESGRLKAAPTKKARRRGPSAFAKAAADRRSSKSGGRSGPPRKKAKRLSSRSASSASRRRR